MKKYLVNQWLKERDAAALSLNVETFKAFYRKWQEIGVYDQDLPSDELIEVCMRKMICMMQNAPEDAKLDAIIWLKDRGWSIPV